MLPHLRHRDGCNCNLHSFYCYPMAACQHCKLCEAWLRSSRVVPAGVKVLLIKYKANTTTGIQSLYNLTAGNDVITFTEQILLPKPKVSDKRKIRWFIFYIASLVDMLFCNECRISCCQTPQVETIGFLDNLCPEYFFPLNRLEILCWIISIYI